MSPLPEVREADALEAEAKLAALVDSHSHGRESRRFCKIDEDRQFTKLIMDDLEQQIRKLRTKLQAVADPT